MENNTWKISQQKYGVAIASLKKAGCLHLTVGDVVHIVEEYGTATEGWYRGYVISNRNQLGVFPKMYIQTKDCEVENPGPFETVTPKEDAIARELSVTLREWWVAWKKIFLRQGTTLVLTQIYHTMKELIAMRRKLLSNMLAVDSMVDLKEEIADMIDWGNGQLGMDLIPRVDGKPVDVDRCSIVKLYRVHLQSAEIAKSSQPRHRKQSKSISFAFSKESVDVFCMLVSFKALQCNIGDESQIVMSVYDVRDQKFVSEQFEIKMNKNGAPMKQEKVNNCFGIFTDLPLDSQKHLYLVVRIYRIGRMFSDNNKKSPSRPYRRPFGVGVMNIEDAKDRMIDNTYQCVVNITNCTESETSFPDKHKELIKGSTNPSFGASGVSSGIGGSLRSTNPSKPAVAQGMSLSMDVTVYDWDLPAVRGENPVLFQKDISIVPKLSQFDVINPGEVRNDIYLTLMEAQFERGNKKSQKNVEVAVTVLGANGKTIENCICHGCGEDSMTHFSTSVYYHENNPKWQETIKISLPMEHLPGSHIRFDIYHCQARNRAEKKLYGFAYLKVTNDLQIVIKDGSHILSIFKCEDEKKIKPEKYTKLQFLNEDYGVMSPGGSMAYERHQRDHIEVKTLLCSTKFTQTTELLGVLNWREEKLKIDHNLDKLMTVQGTEIMKFLQNLMDRLLEMLDDGCANKAPYCSKVFQVIVFILNLLLDTRFENFKPVYEDYLTKTFSFPNVYKHLMDQFSSGIVVFCEGKPFTLSMAMKVLGELMRLITRSRQLELESPFQSSDAGFKKRLQHVFENMGLLLSQQDERLKISQMELLRNLHKCYDPLIGLITKRELADHVRDVITKLPKAKDLAVEIRRTKMEFIKKTVNSELFRDDESRSTLLSLCLNHIKACLIERYFIDIQIATSILGDILEALFALKETRSISQDINTVALSLFEVLLQSISKMADGELFSSPQNYPQVTPEEERNKVIAGKSRRLTIQLLPSQQLNIPFNDDPQAYRGEMVACLTELLRLMEEPHYHAVIQIHPRGPPLKDFLTQVLHTFQELIKPEMLSSDWTIMRMETNNVIFSAVEYFSQALKNHFLEGDYFDQHLWNLYFNLAVEFIVQPSLQLEEYSETKRNKFIERYHDMRIMMGHQIQTLWEKLGTNRRHFIPSMIGPFLKVTLVPEKELRAATLPIFYDMIQSEQKTAGNFIMVEKEIIEKLDMFITIENYGDIEYKHLFKSILLERVQSEPTLKDTGSQFIVSVTNLLEKLLDYRQVYDGEENRDKRMQCTFNILNFYRENKDKRREMYTQYIKKLYDLHNSSRNYVEAGLTLQLYVQLLEWKNEEIHSEMGCPQEQQCERKEKLLKEMIECFDRGKLWEYGIPVCKDLASYYESHHMYRKLSEILQRQASFFTKILDGVAVYDEGSDQPKYYPRQPPSYFRVAYYGMSFPPFVQNKAFIYRGDECLKLQDIINQLTQEFPNAEILKSNHPIEDSKKFGEAQYIQISGVKPVPDPKNSFSAGQDVPREVAQFYECNDVDTFQMDRSFHVGKKDPDNDFKTLCTERTTMKTNHKFPGILQWYEVTQSETSTFSPVATAINAILSACRDLEVSVETCRQTASDSNMKNLSRQLNGMITAQVMGGIPKYQEAFFTDDFINSHPEERDNIQALKDGINEQMSLLQQGLDIMKKDRSEGLDKLVHSLDEELKKLMKRVGYRKEPKAGVHNDLKKWDSGMGSFIDPRPGTPNSQHSSGSNRSSVISSDSRSNDRDDLIDLNTTHESSSPSKPPVEHPKPLIESHSNRQPQRSNAKSVVYKKRPPIPDRKKSDPFPSGVPRPFHMPSSTSTGHIPEEGGPPELPAKHFVSKLLNLNKTDDGFSTTNTPVPPLPPRKSIIGKSPRASKISNTSGELEFALGSNHDPPHISPKIPTIPTGRISTDGDSPRVPPIPAGSPSADGESNSYNSHVLNLADYRNSSTSSHNGQVPAIPGPHSPSGHRSGGLENTPPPIPTRPNRLSNISTASSSSSSSSSHNNQEHESFKF